MPAQTVQNKGAPKSRLVVSYDIINGPNLRQLINIMLGGHGGRLPRQPLFDLKTESYLTSLPHEIRVTEILAYDYGRFEVKVMLDSSAAEGLYAPKSRTGSLSFV